MESGQPSRTARAAAVHRAAHQTMEQGAIFSDPLALRILGEDGRREVSESIVSPDARAMRLFIAVRTRIAEDALRAAVGRGVRQLVVLGAGLDTFAYRHPFGATLCVFEVDHPDTQAWKRAEIRAAHIALPQGVQFVSVDFEQESLAAKLALAGFDPQRPVFFTWLGVVPYLAETAVWQTLAFIAGLAGGAEVVFDYSDPPATLSADLARVHEARAARVTAMGEAWKSYFDATQLAARLRSLGFSEIEDLDPPEIRSRFFSSVSKRSSDRGGHVVRARVG